MTRSEASSDPEAFAQFYSEVLLASFPPAELEPFPVLAEAVASGRLQLRVIRDDAQRLLGGILGEHYPGTGCVLLTYLALSPEARGGGYGSILLTEALRHWGEQYGPCLVLGEFEHPDHHAASAEYGDPAARLRFYERAGARLLPLPYFQPSLAPGKPRVPALLLGVLHAERGLVDAAGSVAGAGIAAFLRRYFADDLARHPGDAAFTRLIEPLERAERIPLLAVEQLDEVPVGLLAEAEL